MSPILKWAGGKRTQLPQILQKLPLWMDTYYEPFLGGGAVFFALAEKARFRRAVLSDTNTDLMNVYRAVQKTPWDVVDHLKVYQEKNGEEYYYEAREYKPTDLALKAAWFIYLNKTCFNGLYRVNKSGKFNVPWGKRKDPAILDVPALMKAHYALQEVTLLDGDFEVVCQNAREGDGVYFDPPFMPVSKTSFTSYQSEKFDLSEHQRLLNVFSALAERGAHVLLSSSDTQAAVELYREQIVSRVTARRSISAETKGRNSVCELLVTSPYSQREESIERNEDVSS